MNRMHTPALLCLILATFPGFSARAETAVPATSPVIQYTGRHLAEGDSVELGYPGIEIVTRFQGASIAVSGEVTGGSSHYNVYLNGIALPRLDLSSGPFSITLASNLDGKDEHTLRIVRRSENWIGITRLDAFSISEGGAFLPVERRERKKLLFIGDSITCGEKADFMDYVEPGSHTWNAEHSFGWFLAKDFDAEVHLISYGGRGLIRDWQGDTTATTAPQFFERTLPDSAEPKWDHSSYSPHLVTIGLGTNDFSQGIPEREAFVSAYVAFVERIHEAHPDAKILLLSGPWFGEGDPKREALNSYLLETISRAEKRGVDYLERHVFASTYPGTKRDAHPTAPQHRAMADDIRGTIEGWLGWQGSRVAKK